MTMTLSSAMMMSQRLNMHPYFARQHWSLAASSAATSSVVNRQPSAPAFSWAWRAFLAPGIGSAPLQMSQFSATWLGFLPSWVGADFAQQTDQRLDARQIVRGGTAGRACRRAGSAGVYLPVSKPFASGLYAISVTSNSWHSLSRPVRSGSRLSRLYST